VVGLGTVGQWLLRAVHAQMPRLASRYGFVPKVVGVANARDGFVVHMSRLLEGSGIASVRFDLSGHGESDGDFLDVTITGEIAEARSVVQAVRTLDFADLPGADHAWSTVPHRTRLHQSTLEHLGHQSRLYHDSNPVKPL
jgi:hypothetical protein